MEKQTKYKILIIDDEKTLCDTMSQVLQEEGYETDLAYDGDEAIEKLSQKSFDVIFCDLKMPKKNGLLVLEKVIEASPETFFIVMTAYGSMETTLEALKKGAHDYVIKPLIFDDVLLKLKHLLDYKQLNIENRHLKNSVLDQFDFDNILGQGPEMKTIYSLIQKVSGTPTTVLITGELGVGKEKLAKAIHYQSSHRRFMIIRCGSYSEAQLDQTLFGDNGVFKKTEEGTLFLDEVWKLSAALQAKLIEHFQTGGILHNKFIRLIVSSSKDLSQEVAKGTFREDLYYRINAIEIKVPPLRARKNDIPFLVKYFVRTFSAEIGKKVQYVSDSALQMLMNYQWKGNIRELGNILERAILLSPLTAQFLDVHDFPPEIISGQTSASYNYKEALRQFESKHIQWVLEKNQLDKKRAAQELGLSLSSLYRKIEELAMPYSN